MLEKLKPPLICASVMESTEEAFLDVVRKAGDADIIELRVDGLRDPGVEKVEGLIKHVTEQTSMPIILTNRMKEEGGSFSGSSKERLRVIRKSLPLVDMADIELRSDEKGRDEIIKKAKEIRVPIILSWHDFRTTPGEEAMLGIIEEEFEAGADIAKVAVKANSKGDVLKLLKVTDEGSKMGRVCTISMGEIGRISRIIAPFFGSFITYGFVTHETAPGQLSISELGKLRSFGGYMK